MRLSPLLTTTRETVSSGLAVFIGLFGTPDADARTRHERLIILL
jgi:hypothetical protein